MTIQKKLLLLGIGGVAPLVISTAVSFLAFRQVDPEKSALVAHPTALANQMQADMMHDAIRADVQAALMASSGAEFDAVTSDVQKHMGTIREMFSKNAQLSLSQELVPIMESLSKELEVYGALAGEITHLARADRKTALAKMPEFNQKFSHLEDGMGKFDDLLEKAAANSQHEAVEHLKASKAEMLTAGLVTMLLLGVASVWISRSITSELQRGISALSESTEHVTLAAGEIANSSQALAEGSSSQASTLEEISASSEEISAMAQRNLDSCHSAKQAVSQSQQQFNAANLALDRMVGAMGEINAQSDKISRIIKVIDEIAFQTNILALNAAVEAARAGQAGMGFAVVADEVRSLAHRCAQAARDTSGLIEESIRLSNEGQSKVSEVTDLIRKLTESAGQTRMVVESVSAGSEEQNRGIHQVSNAITEMHRVTQSTTASAEQSATVSKELRSQSSNLKEVIAGLTALVTG